jgi:hypothetical protein
MRLVLMDRKRIWFNAYLAGLTFTVIMVLLQFISCRQMQVPDTVQLQREFVELRFGGFFHFGIMTFTGAQWTTPNQDIGKFNPSGLDCGQ